MKHGRIVRLGSPAEVITYAALVDVYETEVYVDSNDITGAINVLPLSREYREKLRR
jgi:ABC-type cobalamin/Fe3+-siderophores transport system ATPase subunit